MLRPTANERGPAEPPVEKTPHLDRHPGERNVAILAALREAREMTQAELAQLPGTWNTNVSDIERGTRGLTLNQVVKLARALSISTADLLDDPKAKKASGSKNGILPSRFERIKRLPRSKQQAINEMIDFYLARHAS